MDRLELDLTLNEHSLQVPEKCMTCPHLAKLVTKLSVAQDNKSYITAATEEDVMAASIGAVARQQLSRNHPGMSEEQMSEAVEKSIINYLGSESYTKLLMQASSILEEEDATIACTVTEVNTLLAACPPQGCGTSA